MDVRRIVVSGIDDRPRAHNTHFAAQNIPELWEFIKAGGSKESTDPRYPRVIFQFMCLFPFAAIIRITLQALLEYLVGVRNHCSEFPSREA